MSIKQAQSHNSGTQSWVYGMATTLLIIWALLTWWSVHRADREMRNELLRHTRMMAEAVNVERARRCRAPKPILKSRITAGSKCS